MESLKLGRDKCSKCKKESKPLLMMCLARIVNIFLNNYAKLETSKALAAKKNKSNKKVGGNKQQKGDANIILNQTITLNQTISSMTPPQRQRRHFKVSRVMSKSKTYRKLKTFCKRL